MNFLKNYFLFFALLFILCSCADRVRTQPWEANWQLEKLINYQGKITDTTDFNDIDKTMANYLTAHMLSPRSATIDSVKARNDFSLFIQKMQKFRLHMKSDSTFTTEGEWNLHFFPSSMGWYLRRSMSGTWSLKHDRMTFQFGVVDKEMSDLKVIKEDIIRQFEVGEWNENTLKLLLLTDIDGIPNGRELWFEKVKD